MPEMTSRLSTALADQIILPPQAAESQHNA
jgi:hypothetical protein